MKDERIYRYSLMITDEQTVMMPKNAVIITADHQPVRDEVSVWALVDTNESEQEPRVIEIIGTGNPTQPLDENTRRKYINSFQLHRGMLVFHVFEKITEK